MSKKVIIASDSTCDLGPELIARYGIRIVPLCVNFGEKVYTDGVDIDPDTIYKIYEQTRQLPKTSAPNIMAFSDLFKSCVDEGCAVVQFTISSEMSSTYNNARLAASEYEDVHVVDSRNLTTGVGLLVLHAAELAAQGKSAAEIADECRSLVDKVQASFVVDNLEFLHKGGRCSAVAAFGANLLQLKPCITVNNGKMGVSKKYRGKFAVVLQKYIDECVGEGADICLDRAFITHAGCDEAIVAQCVEKLKAAAPFREVYVTRAGCTVSSHCGRNTLGVLFLKK